VSGLHELVRASAERDRSAPALSHGADTLDYAELWRRVTACAAGLRADGLASGDRVAVYMEKRPQAVVSIFGTSAAGGAFVPVNPLLKPAQVSHILEHSGARVLVTTRDRLEALSGVLPECPELERTVLAEELPGPGSGPAAEPVGRADDELAAILYTSGSTGLPKGVALSHRNLLAGAESVCEYLDISASDRLLAVLPLSFDAGLSQLTTAFRAGAHAVLLEYLLPGEVVRACVEHRITGLTGVPPLWIQLAEREWPPEAVESVRYIANTGGRMPRPTLARLRAIFPAADVFLMYGLTEAFRSTYLDPSEVDARPDSIGKAIPGAEVLVVREDGSECEPGEEGELIHLGALVAMGYWRDPEASAERFRPASAASSAERAVWTGDRAVRDEQGFLYFVGRADEMIKTSGYRVSPTEIEEAARATGLVSDAVALGVADARLGQRVVLVASPVRGARLDSEALLKRLRAELPTYMVPSSVVTREEMPRSPNGKLDRALLRSQLVTT